MSDKDRDIWKGAALILLAIALFAFGTVMRNLQEERKARAVADEIERRGIK